jgi:cyanophycinase
MKNYLLLALLVFAISPVKVFLFGSVLVNDDNPAYTKLIEVVGKPTRTDCDQNWLTTDCPKVAVITSACPDSECGEEEYYIGDGDDEAATGPFFAGLGMAPKHIKVHIDNYRVATDPLTYLGEKHYSYLYDADIIYFNGGDQSRHARCWLQDNGQPNAMFALIKKRALNQEVVLIGVSAGTAIQSTIMYGGGSSFGILYFSNSLGLAPNSIASGNGLNDMRNGTDCLQYE